MKDQELVNALRRLRVETGSLACMGCGHEHNCGVSGCAIINEAVARITMLDESFGEGSVLKMAAAVLETTPEELLQSTRFQAGDTVWVLMRDEDDVPCDMPELNGLPERQIPPRMPLGETRRNTLTGLPGLCRTLLIMSMISAAGSRMPNGRPV